MISVRVGNLGFPLQKETWGFHLGRIWGFQLARNLGFLPDLVAMGVGVREETWRLHILWMLSGKTMN
jgi:hypothetical protein